MLCSAVELVDQLAHLADRLARHDHRRHAFGARRQRGLDPGQAVAVGRDAAQAAGSTFLDAVQVDAVQIVAGLLGRDREPGAIDQAPEVAGRDREAVVEALVAHRGEVGGRQARQIEGAAAGAQRHLGAARGALERDAAAVGQLAHDVVERMGGRGRGAGLADLGRGALDHREVHVGRGQRQTAALGLELDVGQDRDGRAALDHALDMGERLEQCGSLDG